MALPTEETKAKKVEIKVRQVEALKAAVAKDRETLVRREAELWDAQQQLTFWRERPTSDGPARPVSAPPADQSANPTVAYYEGHIITEDSEHGGRGSSEQYASAAVLVRDGEVVKVREPEPVPASSPTAPQYAPGAGADPVMQEVMAGIAAAKESQAPTAPAPIPAETAETIDRLQAGLTDQQRAAVEAARQRGKSATNPDLPINAHVSEPSAVTALQARIAALQAGLSEAEARAKAATA